MQSSYKLAAGVLVFCGDEILLGKEYRERYNSYCYLEFGGKVEPGESFTQAACRECNEETAGTLCLTLNQVEESESKKWFIDYYNEKTNIYYRMYCVKISERHDPEEFKANALGKDNVEMVSWDYFPAKSVVFNESGELPGTETKLYSTMMVRLNMLRQQE